MNASPLEDLVTWENSCQDTESHNRLKKQQKA